MFIEPRGCNERTMSQLINANRINRESFDCEDNV